MFRSGRSPSDLLALLVEDEAMLEEDVVTVVGFVGLNDREFGDARLAPRGLVTIDEILLLLLVKVSRPTGLG